MRKTQSKKVQEDVEMEMTPMIDCVFLLMIFFVLVIDLSQQELEDLILPKAEYAVPDDKPPENRPIINITQDGRMIYKRNTYYDPAEHGRDIQNLNAILEPLLFQWRDYVVDPADIKTESVGGGMKMKVINAPVLVRADKWTEWHYVGKFMEACTNQKAAFWQLELALSEEDKEEKMMGRGRK